LDDKRLSSWNALMITALAEAGAALGEPRYLDAAAQCAEFVLGSMRDHGSALAGERGRLLRTYNDGHAKIDAFLEDHALMVEALIALFEASCEERWLAQANTLAREMIARFADGEHGGFFSTAADGEPLLTRRKDLEDSPIPSGSSSAAVGLLRLAQLTGEREYERHALGAIALAAEIAPRHPTAFAHMLQAMHWRLAPARPLACAVPGASAKG
ncbi:MAG TPA: thioredoxin domain-containing protein, partial [Solirubrobacteraceae bacterium]|nr:thioredoxin domain-containing protein [Solirubrobacteraceae bacterium]